MTLTYGSLFSGIGGLDLAVEQVFGARPMFHCEVDKNASKVLATHWPGVPNLGDITEVDWEKVPRPDILCGGFPCQDISSAGRLAGIKEGTRSGLWYRYADAVRVLRPRLVVVENVGALLVRGLDIVLGSLAEVGYDARWTCLRASDVGAPHRRERLFLVARPRDTDREGSEGEERGSDRSGRDRRPARTASSDPAHTSGTGRGPRPGLRQGEPRGVWRGRLGDDPGPVAELSSPPDAGGERHGGEQDGGVVGRLDREGEGGWPERQRPREVALGGGAATQPTRRRGVGDADTTQTGPSQELLGVRKASEPEAIQWPTGGPDAVSQEMALRSVVREYQGGDPGRLPSLEGAPDHASEAVFSLWGDGEAARPPQGPQPGEQRPLELGSPVRVVPLTAPLERGLGAQASTVDWGPYEAAIRRWEVILGRPAPSPVDDRGRLSPWFTEFMMGLPHGWVAGLLPHGPALKACGNGVVPQQAVTAIEWLLDLDLTPEPDSDCLTLGGLR